MITVQWLFYYITISCGWQSIPAAGKIYLGGYSFLARGWQASEWYRCKVMFLYFLAFMLPLSYRSHIHTTEVSTGRFRPILTLTTKGETWISKQILTWASHDRKWRFKRIKGRFKLEKESVRIGKRWKACGIRTTTWNVFSRLGLNDAKQVEREE